MMMMMFLVDEGAVGFACGDDAADDDCIPLSVMLAFYLPDRRDEAGFMQRRRRRLRNGRRSGGGKTNVQKSLQR